MTYADCTFGALRGSSPPMSWTSGNPVPRFGDSLSESGSGSAREAAEFRALVESHIPCLLAAARKILHCEHAAMDAVQESLITFWRLEQPPANPRAWLLRTVKYRGLHALRKRSRRARYERRASEMRPETSPSADAAAEAEARDWSDWVRELVMTLPEEYAEVLRLRAWEDMDYETIGRTLGLPPGTVRSRLNRARAALITRLLARKPQAVSA